MKMRLPGFPEGHRQGFIYAKLKSKVTRLREMERPVAVAADSGEEQTSQPARFSAILTECASGVRVIGLRFSFDPRSMSRNNDLVTLAETIYLPKALRRKGEIAVPGTPARELA